MLGLNPGLLTPGLRADTEGGWLVCSVDGFHLRREDGDPKLAHQGPIPMISEEEPDRNARVQGAVENLDISKIVQALKTISVRFSVPLGNAT